MGASQIEHNYKECNLFCDLNLTPTNNYYNTLDDDEDNKTFVGSNKSTGDREFQLLTTVEAIESREDNDSCEAPMTNEQRVEQGGSTPVFPTRQKHGQNYSNGTSKAV